VEDDQGGDFLRDAPGKEWDARSPEDIMRFITHNINTFLFLNILHGDLNIK
jgi:hypothetical protein